MIAIVDYGMGNLRSVQKAFERCGADARILGQPRGLERAAAVVLPGVGSFDRAVVELKSRRLWEPVREWLEGQKPFLGLCLGLQLLFESSEEGREKGFGVLKGRVRRFVLPLKAPHMGWNEVLFKSPGEPLARGLGPKPHFYFVHSYYAVPEDPAAVLATTDYGGEFCSAVRSKRTVATQFHPEKSQANGLGFIRSYLKEARVQ